MTEEEDKSVSFTINGAFIANAIAAYGKETDQLDENTELEFNMLVDEGDHLFTVYCTTVERVLN